MRKMPSLFSPQLRLAKYAASTITESKFSKVSRTEQAPRARIALCRLRNRLTGAEYVMLLHTGIAPRNVTLPRRHLRQAPLQFRARTCQPRAKIVWFSTFGRLPWPLLARAAA